MQSILQDWVMRLGLRHQGVLLTCIRGCDTAPKDDPSKLLARVYRNMVIRCHCGDPAKSVSFIEAVDDDELMRRMNAFRKNCDHYPHHYVMHMVHAAGIVAYKGRPSPQAELWMAFYMGLCNGLHMNPETEEQLDERLNAAEEAFGKLQKK